MKVVLQSLRDGAIEVADVPSPRGAAGTVLIRSSRSLVSLGTERMLTDFGKANLIEKARQQPDKVRMVLDKVRTDGLMPTLDAVREKLNQPISLGYCNVGRVMEAGADSKGFKIGDRVASNGKHAEVVGVPAHLCARVPDSVGDEQAAFTVLGAIALQGIRLVQPTLGEAVVVIGLGLVGLMTVQLLRSHGCRVLGIDLNPRRIELARRFGAETIDVSKGEDPLAAAETFSRNRGVDAVIIAASTDSSDPVHQAAQMCRQRGRIVLVGVTGLDLMRSDFYEKELTFQVSCSYGPGRYDPSYEDQGHDYPVGFVRWTEQRNFEAVLDMMADGRLDLAPLISHRFAIERAPEAYQALDSSEALGILLTYPDAQTRPDAELRQRTIRLADARPPAVGEIGVGFIGAGNYANRVLMPAFKSAGARLVAAATTGAGSGYHAARKNGFEAVTTEAERVIADASAGAVVIATPHNSHAEYVVAGLKAGKHVFVEKPLCLTVGDLDAIAATCHALPKPQLLMVGFNRRFAPLVREMKALLAATAAPKALVMTVNAGAIPADHWTQDGAVGGGRIVGEACHFIDLLRHLAGAPIVQSSRTSLRSATADTATLQLAFADGSIGTVHYLANGNRGFPKERVEVFCAGRVLQLDNFRALRGFGWPGFRGRRLWRQDKGQAACVAAFVDAIRTGGPSPIEIGEILEVSRVSIELAAQ